MEPIPADAERSVARSALRRRTLVALCSVGEAYASQLARMLGVHPTRLRAVLHGREPDYRADLSLVALGLAEARMGPSGRTYRITSRGRRKARSLVARARHERW